MRNFDGEREKKQQLGYVTFECLLGFIDSGLKEFFLNYFSMDLGFEIDCLMCVELGVC